MNRKNEFVRQCVAMRTVRATVCGNAHDSVRAVHAALCGSVLDSVWQCTRQRAAVRQCAAVCGSVQQCAAVCSSVQQSVAVCSSQRHLCGSACVAVRAGSVRQCAW
jgi:hypothetical protein